jgi:hypothetical protein
MTLKLQKKYDLTGVMDTIVGGDGARWVKEGATYVSGRFQLDRYHLNRELTAALGRDKETKSKVWHACQCGDVETALQTMGEAMRQTRACPGSTESPIHGELQGEPRSEQSRRGEQAQRIAHACNYLKENRSGLVDYRLGLGEEAKGLVLVPLRSPIHGELQGEPRSERSRRAEAYWRHRR